MKRILHRCNSMQHVDLALKTAYDGIEIDLRRNHNNFPGIAVTHDVSPSSGGWELESFLEDLIGFLEATSSLEPVYASTRPFQVFLDVKDTDLLQTLKEMWTKRSNSFGSAAERSKAEFFLFDVPGVETIRYLEWISTLTFNPPKLLLRMSEFETPAVPVQYVSNVGIILDSFYEHSQTTLLGLACRGLRGLPPDAPFVMLANGLHGRPYLMNLKHPRLTHMIGKDIDFTNVLPYSEPFDE